MHDRNPRALARVLSHLAGRGRQCAEIVVLEEVPRTYALYCHDDAYERPDAGVRRWVFALPDGRTFIVSNDERDDSVIITEGLDTAAGRWARLCGGDLVMVTSSASASAYL